MSSKKKLVPQQEPPKHVDETAIVIASMSDRIDDLQSDLEKLREFLMADEKDQEAEDHEQS
jgi:hypothetical protein